MHLSCIWRAGYEDRVSNSMFLSLYSVPITQAKPLERLKSLEGIHLYFFPTDVVPDELGSSSEEGVDNAVPNLGTPRNLCLIFCLRTQICQTKMIASTFLTYS